MSALFSLNTELGNFRDIILDGRGTIFEPVKDLLKLLVVLEVSFAGLYLAIGGQTNQIELCKKILKVGTLFWLITNYPTVLDTLYSGFLYIGATVGGSTPNAGPDVATLQNPDAILSIASNFLSSLWQYSRTGGATNSVGLPTLTTIIIFILGIPTYVAIALMAINAFITYLEFTLISAVAMALIPFALFKPFAWMFDRAQGAVFSLGIKAMILALVVALSSTVLRVHPLAAILTAPIMSAEVNENIIMSTVTYENCAQFFLMSLTLLILSFHSPSLASTLLGGGPQLTAGSIASAMRGTMHNLQSGKSLGGKAGGMIGSGAAAAVSAPISAAAKLGGGVRGAMQGMRELSASKSAGGSTDDGTNRSGFGQLAKTGMAAMYGAAAATAGDALISNYRSSGGKFERTLSDKGTRGEMAGRKAVLNAANLFNKSATPGKEAEDSSKQQSKNDDEPKKTGNSQP